MNGNLAGTETSDPFEARAGLATIAMDGTFGGGTATIQYYTQDQRWVDLADDLNKHIYSAPVVRTLNVERPINLRVSAVGVGNVYFEVR